MTGMTPDDAPEPMTLITTSKAAGRDVGLKILLILVDIQDVEEAIEPKTSIVPTLLPKRSADPSPPIPLNAWLALS